MTWFILINGVYVGVALILAMRAPGPGAPPSADWPRAVGGGFVASSLLLICEGLLSTMSRTIPLSVGVGLGTWVITALHLRTGEKARLALVLAATFAVVLGSTLLVWNSARA